MKARPLVTVLYEDQRGATKEFGLHKFVLACVYDEIDGQHHVLFQQAEARPLKSNTKVLATLFEDAAEIASDGRRIVAVLDRDRVHEPLNLAATAEDDAVVKAIRERCAADVAITLVLLANNLESVLSDIAACGRALVQELLPDALRKDMAKRDIIFARAAALEQRALRECVQKRNGSIRLLRDSVIAAIRPEGGA